MQKGQNIAYIRVSSLDQNTDRQLADLHFDRTFIDKCSGKDTNRPELQRCFDHAREGDTLHVHSIDRLARNLADLQRIVTELTDKGVAVRFAKENLVFNGTENPMQKLMLQMMGAFAEFERSMIRERQREGIAAAKKKGKQIGAKPKLTPEQESALVEAANQPGANKKELAKEYGISRQAVYNILKKAS